MVKQASHGPSTGDHWRALFLDGPRRAWRGEAELGRVFWGYGVFASVILVLLFIFALSAGNLAIQQILLPLFAAYTVWVLVSVWRCAEHADDQWGLVARWLTVAWAANATLILAFLQMELLTRYLGR